MKAAKTSIFVIGCVATKIIDETKHQPAMLGVAETDAPAGPLTAEGDIWNDWFSASRNDIAAAGLGGVAYGQLSQ
ncbi:MAG: hypothetical protein WCL57_19700 [Chloroflexota bacterium]|jgi:hypothetical protein|nr:hypothetical protein [Chloroflexota bacterium]